MAATLSFNPISGSWDVSFQYDQTAIYELKRRIPYAARVWKPQEKHWVIDDMFIDVFKDIADQYLGGSSEVNPKPSGRAGAAAPSTSNGKNDYEEFFLLCHYDDLRVLFRATSKRLHPDAGGNPMDMSNFNALWQKLETKITRR